MFPFGSDIKRQEMKKISISERNNRFLLGLFWYKTEQTSTKVTCVRVFKLIPRAIFFLFPSFSMSREEICEMWKK